MQSLAIIGTGISGLGAAYFLRDRYELTMYEKNNYIGGHTNTISVIEEKKPLSIDTAFMVYNERTYPLLTRLFDELKVQTKPTSMSFSVQHVPSGLEFCGTGLNGLFAQRRNLLNPSFVRMLLEIDRFNKEAVEVLEKKEYATFSVEQYAKSKGYSDDFAKRFLLPMSSAVWSNPTSNMLNFPIVTLVRFFKNHCFLGLSGHLNWRTCVGGSRQYRDKLLSAIKARLWVDRQVVKVYRRPHGHVIIEDSKGERKEYDRVLIAAHADEALKMLEEPTALEKELLAKFPYHSNTCTLHSDHRLMPKKKRAWSSWNYRIQQDRDGQMHATTIYDMNSLQGVSQKKNYFISVSDPGLIDPKTILWSHEYRHPTFNVESQIAQPRLGELNATGPVYFSGAYFRYGFHEDGLWSALQAARAMTGEMLWD